MSYSSIIAMEGKKRGVRKKLQRRLLMLILEKHLLLIE